ncbi:hypothetical protein AS026_08615 [Rhizobium altiplani]|uniref:Uncharacterized protein n=1 Tax=Rhizobium altiplani TaxID=1864509 RepID=A0A109JKS6_9HYPH|nr:hypothetical protein AS026_08615 [Rhizobium altiplani]
MLELLFNPFSARWRSKQEGASGDCRGNSLSIKDSILCGEGEGKPQPMPVFHGSSPKSDAPARR